DGKIPDDRPVPPKPTPPTPPADLAWVVVEGEALADGTAASDDRWNLVSEEDPGRRVVVHGHRTFAHSSKQLWLLVKAADAQRMEPGITSGAWKLATGTGPPKTVHVNGYIRRDGTH